jgi:hypothetical protein
MKRNILRHKGHNVALLNITACAVLLALSNQRALHAQQNTPAKTAVAATPQTTAVPSAAKPAAKEEKQEEAATADKPGGIKIHGHWVMDIKNPDGTLVKHLDFQNSLTTGGGTGSTAYNTGDQLLAALLSGSVVASDPAIFFVGFKPASATLPANADITNLCYVQATAPCAVVTTPQSILSGLGENVDDDETNLVTTVNFSPTVSWVLSGNFTIPSQMTSLTAVQVYLALCAPTTVRYLAFNVPRLAGSWNDGGAASMNSGVCVAASNGHIDLNLAQGPLTSTLVPNAPQTLLPGQIIQVKVTLTFS